MNWSIVAATTANINNTVAHSESPDEYIQIIAGAITRMGPSWIRHNIKINAMSTPA